MECVWNVLESSVEFWWNLLESSKKNPVEVRTGLREVWCKIVSHSWESWVSLRQSSQSFARIVVGRLQVRSLLDQSCRRWCRQCFVNLRTTRGGRFSRRTIFARVNPPQVHLQCFGNEILSNDIHITVEYFHFLDSRDRVER